MEELKRSRVLLLLSSPGKLPGKDVTQVMGRPLWPVLKRKSEWLWVGAGRSYVSHHHPGADHPACVGVFCRGFPQPFQLPAA